MKQKEYMEYRPLGEEIERIRKGKNIPLRVFDENGVSSRSYQRFVQGNSELRISDFGFSHYCRNLVYFADGNDRKINANVQNGFS
ncbi:Uncharacterised protein [Enterococcus faecalis]|nr:Uncharacterised protein [Enterococcus faecalis]